MQVNVIMVYMYKTLEVVEKKVDNIYIWLQKYSYVCMC